MHCIHLGLSKSRDRGFSKRHLQSAEQPATLRQGAIVLEESSNEAAAAGDQLSEDSVESPDCCETMDKKLDRF